MEGMTRIILLNQNFKDIFNYCIILYFNYTSESMKSFKWNYFSNKVFLNIYLNKCFNYVSILGKFYAIHTFGLITFRKVQIVQNNLSWIVWGDIFTTVDM